MQTDAQLIASFVTRVVNINSDHSPLVVEVIIRRTTTTEPIVNEEKPLASVANHKGSPYIHAFTTNLSDDNKRGLDNLAYWGIGRRKSKAYHINQALALYLAQYEESRQPFPLNEQ